MGSALCRSGRCSATTAAAPARRAPAPAPESSSGPGTSAVPSSRSAADVSDPLTTAGPGGSPGPPGSGGDSRPVREAARVVPADARVLEQPPALLTAEPGPGEVVGHPERDPARHLDRKR